MHRHGTLEEEDVDPRSTLRHVPLIIKYPGQAEGRVVDESVETAHVHELIHETLAAGR
jgi:hypothetical protein